MLRAIALALRRRSRPLLQKEGIWLNTHDRLPENLSIEQSRTSRKIPAIKS
jgi:hypothetical protein